MAKRPAYPFEPRSNAYLGPGQFWAVPVSDGRFACGRALMDWVGSHPPRESDLAGSKVIAQGGAHVKTIRETGGLVLGCRPLDLDAIVGLREVSHRGGGTVYLYEGPRRLRPATREEAREMPVHATWGCKVIELRAESFFVERRPVAR